MADHFEDTEEMSAQSFEPIRDHRMEIVGYRQELSDGRVNIRDKSRELVGWTVFGQTRNKDGSLVSFQENKGLLYKDLE